MKRTKELWITNVALATKSSYLGWCVIVLLVLVVAEICAFLVLTNVPQIRKRAFRPPTVTAEQYAAYQAERDPELGWPSRSWLSRFTDSNGARRSPANAALGDQARTCMSLYGDSFTFGEEVGDAEAWSNLIAEKLGCRVANYGVGGYGADQALLRLERHIAEGKKLGDVVILSLYPDDLNRNINQWRYLLQGEEGGALNFKPVFAYREGKIRLVPLFGGDYVSYQNLAIRPGQYLSSEGYLPDAARLGSPVTLAFPYSWSLMRIAAKLLRSVRGLDSSGPLNPINFPNYYDSPAGPEAEKLGVTAAIIARFAELCKIREKHCALMLIPDPELVWQMSRSGRHDLKGLISDALPGVMVLDATEIFADMSDMCRALTHPDACRGHFSADGNRRLANFVFARLLREGWLSPS